MTHIFLAMQAAIEKTEAKKYRYETVADIAERAKNIRGIGFPISGDALVLVRHEQREALRELMELDYDYADYRDET